MYVVLAGLLLIGTLCGAMIRFMPFVIVLLLAAIVAALSTVFSGGAVLISMVIAIVALQVGYAAGIVGRALLRSWGGAVHAGRQPAQNQGLPTQGKHR